MDGGHGYFLCMGFFGGMSLHALAAWLLASDCFLR